MVCSLFSPSLPRVTTRASEDFHRQCGRYRIAYLYHLTHIANLRSIWDLGLLSHDRAHDQTGPVDIADPQVIALRAELQDTVFGRALHDYVPLYFTPKNPMLYRRRAIQPELAMLCFSKDVLLLDGAVFTDGNAASRRTRFFDDYQRLDQLDWDCIRAVRWTEFPDGRRKRCAEVLVPDGLGREHLQLVAVSNAAAAQAAQDVLTRRPVRVEPTWFF